ncbi:MAG: 5-formyltetrahydrofolate cyclo-ligase [Actinomycetes bacterium]
MTIDAAAVKTALRARIRAARAARPETQRTAAAAAIANRVLALPELSTASLVAAYAATAHEPGTSLLLSALTTRGRVLLPVQRTDGDLDWAVYDRAAPLAVGAHGIHEPTGAVLGADAIAAARVVVVPALAVDRIGRRLGQGGGAYDRALRRTAAGTLVVALLYDDELVDELPAERHDVPVEAVVTPTRVVRLERE